MPTPIIELQRRLTLVGALRAGAERPADGRRPGKRLESFRITSPRKALVEQAAQLYGGVVTPWKSPVGDEWQTYTDVEEIPVLVMPHYSLRQSYELWEGATKRTRLCDGIDEELTGGTCLCAQEGVDRCDLYTRLVVALPELDTVLGWRLITRGANAAHELPTMLQLIEAKAQGQAFVPARLRLDERRGVKDGQVVRYVVPALDLGTSYLALAAGPGGSNHRLQAAVSDAEPLASQELARKSFAAAVSAGALTGDRAYPKHLPPPPPEPQLGDVEFIPVGTEHASAEVPAPQHDRDPDLVEESAAQPPPDETQTRKATAPQRRKLDVLVGKLRDEGHLLTRQLYIGVAGMRDSTAPEVEQAVDGRDFEGTLHWAPLRESLNRMEANDLITRLEQLRDRVEHEDKPTGEDA